MAYVVTSNCVKCKYTDCAEVCPVDAFREGKYMLYIDPAPCIDCNACVDVCPVNAIYSGDKVPESEKEYIALNAEMSLLPFEKVPIIGSDGKKDPLLTARKIDDIKANTLNKLLSLQLARETLDQ